jgi:hypothetical protein
VAKPRPVTTDGDPSIHENLLDHLPLSQSLFAGTCSNPCHGGPRQSQSFGEDATSEVPVRSHSFHTYARASILPPKSMGPVTGSGTATHLSNTATARTTFDNDASMRPRFYSHDTLVPPPLPWDEDHGGLVSHLPLDLAHGSVMRSPGDGDSNRSVRAPFRIVRSAYALRTQIPAAEDAQDEIRSTPTPTSGGLCVRPFCRAAWWGHLCDGVHDTEARGERGLTREIAGETSLPHPIVSQMEGVADTGRDRDTQVGHTHRSVAKLMGSVKGSRRWADTGDTDEVVIRRSLSMERAVRAQDSPVALQEDQLGRILLHELEAAQLSPYL